MKMPNTLDRNQQLERLRERYARRHKDGKSRMLDELCEQHGYSRKHAIKLLGHWLPKPKGSSPPGPEPRYGPVREVLEDIWRAAEQLCGKRLAPALPLWLPHYAKHFNPLLPCQQKLLQEISPATIDRLWVDCKAAPHGLCATRPGTLLREQIPIAGEVWDEKRPGFLEVDSVAHCGGSLAGDFIWSLTYTWAAVGPKAAPSGTRISRCFDPNPGRGSAAALCVARDGFRQWRRMAQLATRALPPRTQNPRASHPLPSLSQRRQRARRTKELDVAAPTPGLSTFGKP
jgi:hypothetical protein